MRNPCFAVQKVKKKTKTMFGVFQNLKKSLFCMFETSKNQLVAFAKPKKQNACSNCKK